MHPNASFPSSAPGATLSLISLVGLTSTLLAAQIVNFGGATYVNQGLVGVRRPPANTLDKFGETFGSFSAFTLDPASWTNTSTALLRHALHAARPGL